MTLLNFYNLCLNIFGMLPDILSLPIEGDTVQTCLNAYLASEEIVRRCSNCKSMKSSRSSEILVPPSTLILHLKRFFYDESEERVTKLHVPVYCPLNLLINNSVMYQFNAVINHMGESSSAGHYNILFHGKEENNFILVDDSDIQYNANISDVNRVSYVVVYDKLLFIS